MKDLNSVTLSGRLVKDPDYRKSANGTQILSFTIASNGTIKVDDKWEDRPSFVDCHLFGNRADGLMTMLFKGMEVFLTGELNQDRWTNAEGKTQSRMTVKVTEIKFTKRPDSAQQSAVKPDDYSPPLSDNDIPF